MKNAGQKRGQTSCESAAVNFINISIRVTFVIILMVWPLRPTQICYSSPHPSQVNTRWFESNCWSNSTRLHQSYFHMLSLWTLLVLTAAIYKIHSEYHLGGTRADQSATKSVFGQTGGTFGGQLDENLGCAKSSLWYDYTVGQNGT